MKVKYPKLTDFQRKVFAELERVPVGKVITYKALAARINCGSARAVGQAMRRNPYAPEIPCHRVVASDGALRGYFGKTNEEGLKKKRELLLKEGVQLDGNQVASTSLLIR